MERRSAAAAAAGRSCARDERTLSRRVSAYHWNRSGVRIAREGWPFIAGAWIVTLGAAFLWWPLAAILAILAIWVVAFFRDPLREGPRGERYVIAAAEGHVVYVTELDEPMYVKERAVRISIFLSVFDVHANRYPVDGTVELVHYNKGKFLHAADEKASLDNEQSSVGMRGPRGRVLVRQIAGLIARRIVTRSEEHTSELQSRLHLVCRLLLEKKKKKTEKAN